MSFFCHFSLSVGDHGPKISNTLSMYLKKKLRLISTELKHMLRPLPTQRPKGREAPKQNTFHGSTLLLINAMEVFAGLPLKQFSSLRFTGQIIKITPKERIRF